MKTPVDKELPRKVQPSFSGLPVITAADAVPESIDRTSRVNLVTLGFASVGLLEKVYTALHGDALVFGAQHTERNP
jgi:hypothetical protein